ncbi:hypothetical protein Acsp02_60050 [Actinoplanes sp. NBRC 103695]|nr:hypothetical protein Acsp02_60050 [Actinoplanes sp. NBRC 103695]
MTVSYRIEDVLESVQEGAPAPRTSTADIITGARRIQARRRWAAVAGAGGAAIVTVAVVAGITGSIPRAQSPSPPAAATPAPSKAAAPKNFTQPAKLEVTVGTSRVGKFQVGPASAATYGYQQIPVYRDGETMEVDGVPYPFPEGYIVLYRPGAYDIKQFGVSEVPSEIYGPATDVTVAGRPGLERQLTYKLPVLADMRAKLRANPRMKPNDPSIKTELFNRTAVAWKFDGTAWATFVPWTSRPPLSRDETLAIIDALKPQAAQPIRAPYTFGWLPDGWRVTAAEQYAADDNDIVSTVYLDRKLRTGADLVQPVDTYPGGGQLRIFHGKPKTSNTPATGGSMKCADVNGYCTMLIDREYFAEFQKVGKGLSMDDVRRILRELKFAKLADQGTWKPLT